jgi:hypothetical protein
MCFIGVPIYGVPICAEGQSYWAVFTALFRSFKPLFYRQLNRLKPNAKEPKNQELRGVERVTNLAMLAPNQSSIYSFLFLRTHLNYAQYLCGFTLLSPVLAQ